VTFMCRMLRYEHGQEVDALSVKHAQELGLQKEEAEATLSESSTRCTQNV